MKKKRRVQNARNLVLREIMAEIQQEKDRRCSFPFWGNWVNTWGNWNNWNNWGNWNNWWN